MAREWKLPDIGEGVHEGEVTKWFVKPGDAVSENDPMVEVMTDKVTVQIPSPHTGTVLELRAKEGEVVKVGTVLVVFGEAGEVPSKKAAAPPPAHVARGHDAARPTPAAPVAAAAGGLTAAPSVRRLAKDLGVDLATVRGAGPGGRITEGDVRRAKSGIAAPPRVAPSTGIPSTAARGDERLPIHGLRKRIFEKMAKSEATAAPFTYVEEIDMTQLVQLRERLNETGEGRGPKLSYLPFFIKAILAALREYPTLNASVDEEKGELVVRRYYNIGIATATEDGLTVTVVRDADTKDLWALAKEIERLADSARAKKLTLEEVQGSTFTITSLGKEGGILATPIINWPEVAIVGIHRIEKRPVVRDDHIVIRDMMYLSCSFDHRVIDGHVGAAFVASVRNFLEHPAMLFVGREGG
ncbi:MAG: dihydrolipoamide acetyltransferase family protein [Methanobacteriota archaeon]